jgi:hypothetical protein
MTLDQKNELELYRLTIKNRLECIDKSIEETNKHPSIYGNFKTLKSAIEDLQSIKAKTDYMLTSLTGWGVHHEK